MWRRLLKSSPEGGVLNSRVYARFLGPPRPLICTGIDSTIQELDTKKKSEEKIFFFLEKNDFEKKLFEIFEISFWVLKISFITRYKGNLQNSEENFGKKSFFSKISKSFFSKSFFSKKNYFFLIGIFFSVKFLDSTIDSCANQRSGRPQKSSIHSRV